MINQNLVVALILFQASCLGNFSLNNKNLDENKFSQYLELFNNHPLPLKFDRQMLIKVKYADKIAFKSITNNYLEFIPEVLTKEHVLNSSDYRALYLLPEISKINIVAIAQYLTIESPQYDPVKIFLISYNANGAIVGFIELALFHPDISESYASISNSIEVEKKIYQFKRNTSVEYSKLLYMIETTIKYKLNDQGSFDELNRKVVEGFFQGNENGYKKVREVD